MYCFSQHTWWWWRPKLCNCFFSVFFLLLSFFIMTRLYIFAWSISNKEFPCQRFDILAKEFSIIHYSINTYSLSYNLRPPIARVLIGQHLIFYSLTSPTCCSSPRKCTPVKYKKRQKAGFPVVTYTTSIN